MAKTEEKYVEPSGVDFATPVVDSFKAYGKVHTLADVRLANAYNHYNHAYSLDDGLKWLIKYVINNGYTQAQIDKVKQADAKAFSMVVYIQAKLLNDGCTLPINSLIYFEERVNQVLSKLTTLIPQSSGQPVKPSVQDYIAKQAGKYIGIIEGQLDDHNMGFEVYKYLSDNEVSAIAAGYIKRWFVRQYDEVFQAYNEMDEQLVEGYSHLNGDDLLGRQLFLKRIVDDCERWASNKKTGRKPRAKKVHAASKQIEKLKYQREYPELKILSINPEAIVGSHQLWLYNTKDRKLAVYNSMVLGGLTIKGTTLQNFSDDSEMKKIRKPEIILPRVLDGGKVVLKHLMEEIKAKSQKVTGRINGFTILLRAVK